MTERHFSILDKTIIQLQRALSTSLGSAYAERQNPSQNTLHGILNDDEQRHAAGLMRINHTGEVCAQALYVGQAAVARNRQTQTQLLEAAQEEQDHLAWCADRLQELDAKPSIFNPFWYAGSYVIGLAAGLRGDGWNLGFVVETERQVEAHLNEHIETLPPSDARSRVILQKMKEDEIRHAEHAESAGARNLPVPIKKIMALTSSIMKAVAYRL